MSRQLERLSKWTLPLVEVVVSVDFLPVVRFLTVVTGGVSLGILDRCVRVFGFVEICFFQSSSARSPEKCITELFICFIQEKCVPFHAIIHLLYTTLLTYQSKVRSITSTFFLLCRGRRAGAICGCGSGATKIGAGGCGGSAT